MRANHGNKNVQMEREPEFKGDHEPKEPAVH